MPLFGYNARKIEDNSRAISARLNGTYSNQPSAREYNMTADGEIGNPSDPVKVRQVLANKAIPANKPKNNNSGYAVTKDPYAGYRGQLDDLYNKVMGYGGYNPGSYSAKYDTKPLEGQLAGWLNEIDNYGEFKYDLNADMLYKQMVDNSVQKGQLAAQDVMANAAALSGGYGNSYAAALGNQAYQQFLTDVNNNIPQLQQQALGVWQAGLDQLYGQLDAGSQQLNNLLALEAQNFAQWQANEANAFNAWNAGYQQVLDQYNLGLNHANTMVSWQPQTVYSGGSSTPKQTATTQTATGNQVVLPNGKVVNTTPAVTNPYTSAQLEEMLKLYGKK